MADQTASRRTDVSTYLFVIVFAYGTTVHVVQLIAAGSSDGNSGTPTVIRWFFLALVVLDPLVAVLIALRRRIGLVVGNGVLVFDAAANAIVNYPPFSTASGVTTGRFGQGVVTLLGLMMVVATPGLWRRYR